MGDSRRPAPLLPPPPPRHLHNTTAAASTRSNVKTGVKQVGGMAVGHRSKMPRGEIIVGESERSSADSYLLLFVYRFNLF